MLLVLARPPEGEGRRRGLQGAGDGAGGVLGHALSVMVLLDSGGDNRRESIDCQ